MLPLALILLLTPSQAWGSPSAEEFAVEDIQDKEWAPPPQQPRATPRLLRVVNGAASWYGPGFYGRQTAFSSSFKIFSSSIVVVLPYLP